MAFVWREKNETICKTKSISLVWNVSINNIHVYFVRCAMQSTSTIDFDCDELNNDSEALMTSIVPTKWMCIIQIGIELILLFISPSCFRSLLCGIVIKHSQVLFPIPRFTIQNYNFINRNHSIFHNEFTDECIVHIITIKINDEVQIYTKIKSMNDLWSKNEFIKIHSIPFYYWLNNVIIECI